MAFFNKSKKEEVKDKKSGKLVNKEGKMLKGKYDNEGKVSSFTFILEEILNRLTRGALDAQSSDFEFAHSTIMSVNHKKKVLQITEFPELISASHLETIRVIVKNAVPEEIRNKINVEVIEHTTPYVVSKSNKKIRNAEKNTRRQLINVNKELAENHMLVKAGLNMMSGRDTIETLSRQRARLSRKANSYESFDNHVTGGHKMVKSYIFIEIFSNDITLLSDTVTDLKQTLQSNNYKVRDVYNLVGYLKEFGLASISYGSKPKIGTFPMPLQTNISSMSPRYDQGIIRSKGGDIYVGHERTKNYPVYFSYSENTDKYVELFLADSGSGKTVSCMTRALFAAMHKGLSYYQVVRDYKGGEWAELANVIGNSNVISMGIESPKFINTLRIPYEDIYNLPGQSAYQLCASYTVKRLSVLAGADDSTDSNRRVSIQNVCEDIVTRVYLQNNILIDNVLTYPKSEYINFIDDIWTATNFITSESSDMVAKHGKDILGKVKTALIPYFSPLGPKRYMYENPVSIPDLIKNRLVVFDYATNQIGGQETLLQKEKNVRFFDESFFVRLYSGYHRKNNNHTLYWLDDLQVQFGNIMLMEEVGDIVTVGRSLNMKPILITNSVEPLLNSSNPALSLIKENINNLTIGRIKEDTGIATLRYLGLNFMSERAKKVFSNEGDYNRYFLVAFRTGEVFEAAYVKVKLPEHIIKSKVFTKMAVESNDMRIY